MNPRDLGVPHDTWRPHQYETYRSLYDSTHCHIFAEAPTGCHAAGQGILMYDGTVKPVESMRQNDLLMGPDSQPRRVISLVQGLGEMCCVVPVKGSPFVVNLDHILTLQRTRTRRRPANIRRDCIDYSLIDVSVRKWLSWSKTQKHIHKLVRAPVDFPISPFEEKMGLPVDPYFLGVLLGDGSMSSTVSVTTMDSEIVECVQSQASDFGLRIRIGKKEGNQASTYFIVSSNGGEYHTNGLIRRLQGLGLHGLKSGSKFVPYEYKVSSKKNRLELLAGLIDTDGSASGRCSYDYISKSEQLANGIAFVARSLGMAAYVKQCEKRDQWGGGGTYYRVSMSGDTKMIPCRIPRKRTMERRQKKSVLRTGFSVEILEQQEYYGFCLGGDGRYLLDDFTITHNTGKSSMACALGHDSDVMVLVATLGLLDQYSREYGFTIIKGRQEYKCADLDKLEEWSDMGYDPPTAFDCHLPKMSDCEFLDFCPYITARNAAMRSTRVAMTYKYAARAQWPKLRRGILVCDEGHSAAEEILSCTEFIINEYHTNRFNCPPPSTCFTWRVQEMVNNSLKRHIMDYLNRVFRYTSHFSANADKGPLQAGGHRLHLRVDRMMEDLETHDSWFLDASPRAFQLRPLDARPVAHLISDRKDKCIYMSATIGDPGPLANEMGIGRYDYLSTPHLIPKGLRPVHSIFTPRMTKVNRDRNPGLYRAQATAIAHFIKSNIPPSWRGLILTTSYFKIQKLTEFLSQDGDIGERVWTAPKKTQGVSKRIEAFLKDPSEGIIAIDTIQGWGHGLDLRGDLGRFVIVAGVPHPNPSDPFEQARMKRKGGRRYARWTAYNAIVQACGRVTRGDRGEDGEYTLNVAALADGSCIVPVAKRLYYPKWFTEAMV